MNALPLLCVLWSLPEPWPPAEDLHRFPPKAIVDQNVTFAEKHIRWLESQRDWHKGRDVDGWLWEARECLASWTELQRCHYASSTREKLHDLKWRLGWADYSAGRMPPPVPLWRFERR